jgi:hypothetical protein
MRNTPSPGLAPGDGQPESERAGVSALVVASAEAFRPFPACSHAMTGRKISACSDRCRAALSRRNRGNELASLEEQLIRALTRVRALRGSTAA